MDQEISKDGDLITITTTTVQTETYDLGELKAELNALESEVEPTVPQMLEAVRNNQTLSYFSPSRQLRIDFLRSKINELEEL